MEGKWILSLFWLGIFTVSSAKASWRVQQRLSKGQIQLIKVESIQKSVAKKTLIRDLPEFLDEQKPSTSRFQEVLYPENELPVELQKFYKNQVTLRQVFHWPGSEVRTLVSQGPTENRIDLTIVGDGYTTQEKDKFFADAERITKDLFVEKTFSSYLPLFNVYAVFVPSAESGITDTVKRNTALGLYRSPANSKRGIMPGNTSKIEDAIALAPAADFPILIANDEYYGGLGGRYAITTRSLTSGSMVLRHELGHNFGNVGEEYDGGSVYSGANFSNSAKVPWAHWLKSPLKVFESHHLSGDYVWQALKGNPYQAKFTVPKGNFIFEAVLSSVGWASARDVRVSVDGQEMDLDGVFTVDRSFFGLKQDLVLKEGAHQIRIEDVNQDGDNMLAFSVLYAHPTDIIKDSEFIGAYSVFNDQDRRVGYRPSFNGCLMRDMRYMYFCTVDKENMWIRFLAETQLIDQLTQKDEGNTWKLTAHTPQLQGLVFTWMEVVNGKDQVIYQGSSPEISLAKNRTGQFKVAIEFTTPEVRKPGARFYTLKQFKL